jgi:LAGLIDADG DNA endonuclease family
LIEFVKLFFIYLIFVFLLFISFFKYDSTLVFGLFNFLPISKANFSTTNFNSKRLTKEERESFNLSPELKQILIGNILGDLCLQKQTPNSNVRLLFEQGSINQKYLLHLYLLFKNYCGTKPKITNRKLDSRTGKINSRIKFSTFALPCFNEFYDLFYLNGKKMIPLNIEELLTPRSLAYWAMDDGSKIIYGFYLHTPSYSIEEIEILINALYNKFDITSSLQKSENIIYIKAKSMGRFKELVTPHFHKSMLYKLR